MADFIKTPEQIQKLMLESFQAIDNIQRNSEREAEIVLNAKASLLVRSAIGTGRFAKLLMRDPPPDGFYEFVKGQEIDLELPAVARTQNRQDVKFKFKYKLKSVILAKSQHAIKHHSLEAVCRPHFPAGIINAVCSCRCPIQPLGAIKGPLDDISNYLPAGFSEDKTTVTVGNEDECFAAAIEEMSKLSLLDICSRINPQINLESVFNRTRSGKTPYSPMELLSDDVLKDCFFDYDSGKEFNTRATWNWGEEISAVEKLERILTTVVSRPSYECPLDQSFEDASSDCYKGVYAFRDDIGYVSQLVVKIFDWGRQTKSLVPCIPRNDKYNSRELCFFVPLKKQILFNRDKIKQYPEAIIILTDSIEIADRNKAYGEDKGIVWTSWTCDDGIYDQVDWSPLDKREVYYLVTNHSGIVLTRQFTKAKMLADYLKEKKNLEMKFIMVETNYDLAHYNFLSIVEFETHWNKQKPKTVTNSVMVFGNDEFTRLYEAAIDELNRPPFWERQETKSEEVKEPDVSKKSRKKPSIPYVLRPIIKKGSVTFIAAETGRCKSIFTLSICGAIIADKSLFDDVCWTVPKSIQGKSKILYFDFEFTRDEFDDNMKTFFNPYISKDKERKDILRKNFMEVILKSNDIDLSSKKGQDFVMDHVKKLEGQGDPDAPIRVIVFDTYTKMAGGMEWSNSWKKMEQLLNKIKDHIDGVSILFIHHLNDDKDYRGFAEKVNEAGNTVKMGRKNKIRGSATTPIQMTMDKCRFSKIDTDFTNFEFAWNNDKEQWVVTRILGRDGIDEDIEKWKAIKPADYEREFFCEVVNQYDKAKYINDGVAEMLGIVEGTYYQKRIDYGIREPRSPKSQKAE